LTWRRARAEFKPPGRVDAYFVHFDPAIVSRRDIDLDRLIMLIGFASVRPAEFVIIRLTIQQA